MTSPKFLLSPPQSDRFRQEIDWFRRIPLRRPPSAETQRVGLQGGVLTSQAKLLTLGKDKKAKPLLWQKNHGLGWIQHVSYA